jgi:hypothetical protein
MAALFATLVCAVFSNPAPTAPAGNSTTVPNFQLTADYQSAFATQLAATEIALQGQQVQIEPTLQSFYTDQCTFQPDLVAGGAFLEGLNIDLWPEYDRPSMLVIYRIMLSPMLALPVALSFRIPARAGEPNAVAVQQGNGTLLNAGYTRRVEGDWATISFTTTAQAAQLEYYDPGLTKSGYAHHYDFQWASDYSIASLLIRVRPTQKITSMQITPQMPGPGLSSDGTLYFCRRLGPVEVDTPISFGVDYEVDGGP